VFPCRGFAGEIGDPIRPKKWGREGSRGEEFGKKGKEKIPSSITRKGLGEIPIRAEMLAEKGERMGELV